jgi:hypothetical protein
MDVAGEEEVDESDAQPTEMHGERGPVHPEQGAARGQVGEGAAQLAQAERLAQVGQGAAQPAVLASEVGIGQNVVDISDDATEGESQVLDEDGAVFRRGLPDVDPGEVKELLPTGLSSCWSRGVDIGGRWIWVGLEVEEPNNLYYLAQVAKAVRGQEGLVAIESWRKGLRGARLRIRTQMSNDVMSHTSGKQKACGYIALAQSRWLTQGGTLEEVIAAGDLSNNDMKRRVIEVLHDEAERGEEEVTRLFTSIAAWVARAKDNDELLKPEWFPIDITGVLGGRLACGYAITIAIDSGDRATYEVAVSNVTQSARRERVGYMLDDLTAMLEVGCWVDGTVGLMAARLKRVRNT